MRYCPNDKCQFLKDHHSRSTYEDNVEKCIDCGTALMTGDPTPPPATQDDEVEDQLAGLVPIVAFENAHAAYLAKHTLESQGIPAFLRAQNPDAAVGDAPEREAPVELAVPSPYAPDARRLLDQAAAACNEVEPPAPEDFEEEESEERDEEGAIIPVCPQCGKLADGARRGFFGGLFGGRRKTCPHCGASLTTGADRGGEASP